MIKEIINKKNIRLFLLAILIIEILLIFIGNILRNSMLLDDDMSMLFVHVMEMAKNRSFVISDWSFINSMEIDGPAIFAMPLYIITKNIYLSFSISILIFISIWIWTVLRIFRYSKIEYALLSLVLIFIPYGYGFLDYFNMLFFNGAYYIIKVLLPLMLISVVVLQESGEKLLGKEEIVFGAIYFILLFTSTFSSGVYVAACGIFPILAFVILRAIILKRIPKKTVLVFMAGSLIAIGVGFVMTHVVGAALRGNNMSLCNIYDLPGNITAVFFGLFELFKGIAYEDVAILSFQGIHKFLRICFTILLIAIFVFGLNRWTNKKLSLPGQMFLSIFIWNYFVLCITSITNYLGTAEYRYHLIGVIPLLCVMAEILYDYSPQILGKGFAVIFVGLMLIYLNVSSFGIFYSAQNPNIDLEQVCEYVGAQEIDNIYFLNDMYKAEICQLIDDTDAEYLDVDFDGNVIVRDYYDKYNHETINTDNTILIVNTDIWEIVDNGDTWTIGENEIFFGGKFSKIESFGFFDIYKSK